MSDEHLAHDRCNSFSSRERRLIHRAPGVERPAQVIEDKITAATQQVEQGDQEKGAEILAEAEPFLSERLEEVERERIYNSLSALAVDVTEVKLKTLIESMQQKVKPEEVVEEPDADADAPAEQPDEAPAPEAKPGAAAEAADKEKKEDKTFMDRANDFAEKVGGIVPGTSKMSQNNKRALGYAVTIGGVLLVAWLATAFSKGKSAGARTGILAGLLVGGAALIGLKMYADKIEGMVADAQKKAKELIDGATKKADELINGAKEKKDEVVEGAQQVGDQVDDLRDSDEVRNEALELQLRVSTPLLVRVFGDEADSIGMDIFSGVQQKVVCNTMLRMSTHPAYGKDPPVTVGELITADEETLLKRVYDDVKIEGELGDRRRKACEFVLSVFKSHETRLREEHKLLVQSKDSDLPDRFEDMTFEQAFKMISSSPVRMMGAMAEHSYDIAKSAMISLGTNASEAVSKALEATKDKVEEVSMNEFAYFLRFAPEADRKHIRMKAIASFVASERSKFAHEVQAKLGEEGVFNLNDQERNLMVVVLKETESYSSIEDGSLLDKACNGKNAVKKALRDRWPDLSLGDKIQLFYLVQRGEELPLALRIAYILKKDDEVAFGTHASEIAFNCVSGIASTAAGWLMNIDEMPEEWQRFYRMVRREAVHRAGEGASVVGGAAISTPGKIGMGGVVAGLVTWEGLRRIAMRIKGPEWTRFRMPSVPRAIHRSMPVFGKVAWLRDFNAAEAARIASSAPPPPPPPAPPPKPPAAPPKVTSTPKPPAAPPKPTVTNTPKVAPGLAQAVDVLDNIDDLKREFDAAKQAGNSKRIADLLTKNRALLKAADKGDEQAQAMLKLLTSAEKIQQRLKNLGRGLIAIGLIIDVIFISVNEWELVQARKAGNTGLASILEKRRLSLVGAGVGGATWVSAPAIVGALHGSGVVVTVPGAAALGTAPMWVSAGALAVPVVLASIHSEAIYGAVKEWDKSEQKYTEDDAASLLSGIKKKETERTAGTGAAYGDTIVGGLGRWIWSKRSAEGRRRYNQHYQEKFEETEHINFNMRDKMYSAYFMKYTMPSLLPGDLEVVQQRAEGIVASKQNVTEQERNKIFEDVLRDVATSRMKESVNAKRHYITSVRGAENFRMMTPQDISRADAYAELVMIRKQLELRGEPLELTYLTEDGAKKKIDLTEFGYTGDITSLEVRGKINSAVIEYHEQVQVAGLYNDHLSKSTITEAAESPDQKSVAREILRVQVRGDVLKRLRHHINRAEQRIRDSKLTKNQKDVVRVHLRGKFEEKFDVLMSLLSKPECSLEQYNDALKQLEFVWNDAKASETVYKRDTSSFKKAVDQAQNYMPSVGYGGYGSYKKTDSPHEVLARERDALGVGKLASLDTMLGEVDNPKQ